MKSNLILKLLTICLAISITVNFYQAYALNSDSNQSCDSEYVKYRPVFFNLNKHASIESNYIIDTSHMNKAHVKNAAFVLKFHAKQFKFAGDTLMITRALWEDKDYVANITKKADDQKWLAERMDDK